MNRFELSRIVSARLRTIVSSFAMAATVVANSQFASHAADGAGTVADQLLRAARSVKYVTTTSSATMVTRNGVVDLTKDFTAAHRDRCKRLGPNVPECQPTPVPGVTVVLAEASPTRIVLTFAYSGGFPFDREAHLADAAKHAVREVQPSTPVLFRQVFTPPESTNEVVAHQLTYDPIREILQQDF